MIWRTLASTVFFSLEAFPAHLPDAVSEFYPALDAGTCEEVTDSCTTARDQPLFPSPCPVMVHMSGQPRSQMAAGSQTGWGGDIPSDIFLVNKMSSDFPS